MKYAYIFNGKDILDIVRRYLPSNYSASYIPDTDIILISGFDVRGWSLNEYVIPRLASGLYYAKEMR